MLKDEEEKSGITRSSFIAILYAMFVFTPALIYLNLMTGLGGLSVAWFTMILWIEFGRLQGSKLTKQEAFLIFTLVGVATFVPTQYVYRAYFVQSDIARFFGLAGEIPDWWAPPLEAGIFEIRTFFHPAWIIPLGIAIGAILLARLLQFILAFFAKAVFIEIENLPFPLQRMESEAILTLTGKDESASRTLFLFAIFGFFYGFLVYALPSITEVLSGVSLSIIPAPWVDMTRDMERLGLGGAIFGVATDLSPIATAFVLPASTILSIVLGSFAVYTIGNWLTVAYNLSPVSWWEPGMSAGMAWQRSTLYFWTSPIVGIVLAVGIVPFIRHPRVLVNALKSLVQPSGSSKERILTAKTFVILYIACIALGIAFFVQLAPNFFWSSFILVIPMLAGTPLILTLIQGRMRGYAGVVPPRLSQNLVRSIYLLSGYAGTEIWFVPDLWTVTGQGILSQFKLAQLTKTSLRSFVKAYWIITPIAILVGFMYMELFWRVAPIPSGAYPGAAINWPVDATISSLWMKGLAHDLFRPTWLLGGFGAGFLVFLLSAFTPIPLSLAGLGIGVYLAPPFATTYLIGIIATLIFRKLFGVTWYRKNRRLVAAGMLMGEGLAIALGVAAILMVNAIWVRPF